MEHHPEFTITNISVGYKVISTSTTTAGGLVVSTPNGLSGDCNGVPLAVAGSGSVTWGRMLRLTPGTWTEAILALLGERHGHRDGLQTNLTDPLNCDCIPPLVARLRIL